MYSEIASNKRRSVVFIGLFFVIWLAIGAVCGLLFKAVYRHSANNGFAPAPPTNYGWTPVIIGISDDTHTEVLKKHAPHSNTNDWPGFDGTERVLAGNLEVLAEAQPVAPQQGPR